MKGVPTAAPATGRVADIRSYRLIAEALHLRDLPIFGVMGGSNVGLLAPLIEMHGTRYYAMRHENAAVAAADGYARVSGRVGLCSVTQGPGLTNALTALIEAHKARSSVLLLVGESSPVGNQYINQQALCQSLGIAYERLSDGDALPEQLGLCLGRAKDERRPIVAALPSGSANGMASSSVALPETEIHASHASEHAVCLAIEEIAHLIQQARRPLILAGRGAVLSNAASVLEALGDRAGALLATTTAAKGIFPEHPFDLGVAGRYASEGAADLMSQADLVLVFGAGLNGWTTRRGSLFGSATMVHVDCDPNALGRYQPVDRAVVGDVAVTARGILDELMVCGDRLPGWRSAEIAAAIAHSSSLHRTPTQQARAGLLHPWSIMAQLDAILPEDRTIVTDSGHFMGFAVTGLRVPDAAGLVFAQQYQSVGLGLATAMGAALANPNRLCVAVVGDGGLMMSLGEMETAIRAGIRLLIVVMNDAAYGVEYHMLVSLGLSPDSACFPDVDFAAVAESLGAAAVTAHSVNDLAAIRPWLDHGDSPLLVDCKVDRTVAAPWFS